MSADWDDQDSDAGLSIRRCCDRRMTEGAEGASEGQLSGLDPLKSSSSRCNTRRDIVCGYCRFNILFLPDLCISKPSPLATLFLTSSDRQRCICWQTWAPLLFDACSCIDDQVRQRASTAFQAQNKRLAMLQGGQS